ncbi:nuclear receptor coactivator 5-like isoform X2 [Sorex araneus]|uniref:nuclear receptor coactivator 5-like isoform X2 n=1 Tax=Sorex araneus TaxID=42254 RepID=UPI002433D40D|nr:nuclear receptor coactivator 5-like isoform X2 [Sorex araneus]XP_055001656.1 nuclear receptor coactivator 5-like isoform X2 [Sorex araneus]XP_055001657.1 nuclear receptor coactivator 5-like isoform X2 [Sorex araneus]
MSSLARLHRGQYGRPLVTKSKPYKPILPTAYSPQESYLKEGEDMLSRIEELWRTMSDCSKGNDDDQERYSQLDDASGRDAQKEGLFRHFYQALQKDRDQRRPSDCIVVSIFQEQREYATAVGHRLQDHGLVVEMIHLTTESGLTRALQEVREDGSPFCILVERSNVKLSSCTVILLHESIKIHRHMPLEDALALVGREHQRFLTQREQRERASIALRAGDLVDDFLARECLSSHTVPLGIRHLLFLLTEGKHLHRNELDLLIDYLKTRRGQLEGPETPSPLASSDAASFAGRSTPPEGKPPPLLPTPGQRSYLGPLPAFPGGARLGERPGGGSAASTGLANPKGPLPPPLLLVAPCKRPAPLGCLPPKPAKRPVLLGEKPGLLAPPPALLQSVLPRGAGQPMSLLN